MATCSILWSYSQNNFGKVPENLRNISARYQKDYPVDLPLNFSSDVNPYAAPPKDIAVNETYIGVARFDNQTNQSVQNRIYLFPDGTVGATWICGDSDPSFPDRGTGYNFYNGIAWHTAPTARIEASRSGWPSYVPVGNGEAVISHNGTDGLFITKRAIRGLGPWATSTLVGPVTTGGTTKLLWPRAISVGNTIHLIACTDQSLTSTPYYYQGLSQALVYYKSTDGGASWSAPSILPGMEQISLPISVNNLGFSGDSYSWAAPLGDTIAFVAGDSWMGVFAMKSFNAGASWTKVPVYIFPNPATAPTPVIPTTDGSVACAIDRFGKVHVVFGKMRVSDDDFSDSPPTSSYYPYTDGLIYWNENMNPLDTGQLNDDAQLLLNGQLLAKMIDFNNNGIIDFPVVNSGQFPFGKFFLSLTSMPQMLIEGSTIFVTFSSCREDKSKINANPNEELYRHLFLMKSNDLGLSWCDSIPDLTGDPLHDNDECVYASLSYTTDLNLHIVFMADSEPGLANRGDLDAYTNNSMYYLKVARNEICATSVETGKIKSAQIGISPNPATKQITVALPENAVGSMLSVYTIQGQMIGMKKLTAQQNTIDISGFSNGLYYLVVDHESTRWTGRFVKE